MICGIYKITNIITGAVYIGKSGDIDYRWECHRYDLAKGHHHNRHLQNAWAKYSPNAFEFAVVEVCSRDQLAEREIFWVEASKSSGEVYNIADPRNPSFPTPPTLTREEFLRDYASREERRRRARLSREDRAIAKYEQEKAIRVRRAVREALLLPCSSSLQRVYVPRVGHRRGDLYGDILDRADEILGWELWEEDDSMLGITDDPIPPLQGRGMIVYERSANGWKLVVEERADGRFDAIVTDPQGRSITSPNWEGPNIARVVARETYELASGEKLERDEGE